MGAFLVTDNRITMGHSVACSVQLLTLLTCSTGLGSLGSLCSLTWFTGLLTVSWDGWNQLTNTVFTLKMQKLGKVVRLSLTVKQGRIHGYPSCVRVGRGCIWGYLITWAGAVRPKTAKTQSKVWWTDGGTNRRTDGWTDRQSGVKSRVARDWKYRCSALIHDFIHSSVFLMLQWIASEQ